MASSHPRFHYGWVVIIVGTLVVFGSLGLARFSYTVMLPVMQESLAMDNTQAGALATANLVGYLALSVIGGALAARYGPRLIISVALALAGVGMLLTGLANGFLSAAVCRAVVGVGSGASNVSMMGLLSAWFAPRRRGFASGIVVAGSSVALIFLGTLVPRILYVYGENGWRMCWFIFGGVTLLLAIGGFIFLRNRPAEKGLKPFGADTEDIASSSRSKGLEWGLVYRSPAVWHVGLVYVAYYLHDVLCQTSDGRRRIFPAGGWGAFHGHGLVQPGVRADLGYGVECDRTKRSSNYCIPYPYGFLYYVCAMASAGWFYNLGHSVWSFCLEYPGHYGCHMRGCSGAKAGSGRDGLYDSLLRHWAGYRSERGRGYGGRRRFIYLTSSAGRGGRFLGAFGSLFLGQASLKS